MAAGRRSPSLGERVSRAISQFAGEGCLTPFLDGRTLQGRNRTWRAFGRRSGRLDRSGGEPSAVSVGRSASFGMDRKGPGTGTRGVPLDAFSGLVRDKSRQFPRPLTLKTCRCAFGGSAVAERCKPAVKDGAPEFALPAGCAVPKSRTRTPARASSARRIVPIRVDLHAGLRRGQLHRRQAPHRSLDTFE
jgi:hypothetical protein